MIKGMFGPQTYYAADAGAGGAPAAQTTGDATGQPVPPEGTAQDGGEQAAAFSQADLNRILAQERRLWQKQQEEAATRARQQAEDEARAKQGEYQQLAEQRATRLTQMETEQQQASERLTAYQTAMEQQLKARLRALPEEIRAMDPGGDVLQRYDWVAKAEAAAQKLAVQRTPGTPSGPEGTGGSQVLSNGSVESIIAQKRASGDYGM